MQVGILCSIVVPSPKIVKGVPHSSVFDGKLFHISHRSFVLRTSELNSIDAVRD